MDLATEASRRPQDSRSSSTQSLVPSETNVQDQRRRLLLIFVHGFMGNETSFQSFPAHVHNLLTVLLKESHVVHTKVYPRYRSKRKISFARDDFSTWLRPHEADTTDVVLLGHSMGGLLTAEVALISDTDGKGLRHKILGTINFDVPFLGMHPGVVKSGLASIFAPAADPQNQQSGQAGSENFAPKRTDTLWEQQDPNYNPSFNNDVVLPMRKGWRNAFHFLHKHSSNINDLTTATKKLVTSHVEFGGAMANYTELKLRYGRIRALEEDNEEVRRSVIPALGGSLAVPRVRFINYYTASTGRAKKPKSPEGARNSNTESVQPQSVTSLLLGDASTLSNVSSQQQQLDSFASCGTNDGQAYKEDAQVQDWEEAAETLTIGQVARHDMSRSSTGKMTFARADGVSDLPDLPKPPPPLDVSFIQDPATKKLVVKEHARAVKAHEKAVKEREKAVRTRQALQSKSDQKSKDLICRANRAADSAATESAQQRLQLQAAKDDDDNNLTQSQREHLRLEKESIRVEREGRRMQGKTDLDEVTESPQNKTTGPSVGEDDFVSSDVAPEIVSLSNVSPSPSNRTSRSRSPLPATPTASNSTTSIHMDKAGQRHKDKSEKDRTFCALPPRDSNGQLDPTWVRVFMRDVDEVGAHCGLFFVDERYERLVGEVAERIEGWVKDDMNVWDVD